MKKSNIAVIILAGLTAASPALATESLDVSGAVTIIGLTTAAISSVGLAKLTPAATAVAFKWVKGAIFS